MRTRVRASLVPGLVLLTAPVLWLALQAPALAQAASAEVSAVRVGAQGTSPDGVVVVPAHSSSLRPETYGTVSPVVKVVGMTEFSPPDSTIAWNLFNSGNVAMVQTTTTGGDWWGLASLPAGAILNTIELDACDTTATGQIVFGMAKMNSGASTGVNITSVGGTGVAATPGCGFFPIPISGTQVVDNRNNTYLFFVAWQGDFTSANRVFAMRVFYHLQVSPAPGVATFADVPTSSGQFKFVEALFAAGITGGCGGSPPNYCPNDPVTRGQMAVFLSVALGLHFPN